MFCKCSIVQEMCYINVICRFDFTTLQYSPVDTYLALDLREDLYNISLQRVDGGEARPAADRCGGACDGGALWGTLLHLFIAHTLIEVFSLFNSP